MCTNKIAKAAATTKKGSIAVRLAGDDNNNDNDISTSQNTYQINKRKCSDENYPSMLLKLQQSQ